MKKITFDEFISFIKWAEKQDFSPESYTSLFFIATFCHFPKQLDEINLLIKNKNYDKILEKFKTGG